MTFSPREIGYDFSIWTLKAIRRHIKRKQKKKMLISGTYRMSKRNNLSWIVTRLMPAKADLQKKWVYRKEKVYHKKSWSLWCHFNSERKFVLSFRYPPKSQALRCNKPILPIYGSRERLNVIGAIDPINDKDFFAYIGSLNTKNFKRFLQSIAGKYSGLGKPYIFTDNARSYYAKSLKQYLDSVRN